MEMTNAWPIDIDGTMENRRENSLQKKPQLHHPIGMVSPDVNNGQSFANRTHKVADKESPSNIQVVSPEVRSAITSLHRQYAVVTPNNTTTPTKSTLSPQTPLRSPFVSSMALLDSKLNSLKKDDCALNERIESVRAWLDGSGMEDSFDGELWFDDWDESEVHAVSGGGKINEVDGTKKSDNYADVKASYSVEDTDDSSIEIQLQNLCLGQVTPMDGTANGVYPCKYNSDVKPLEAIADESADNTSQTTDVFTDCSHDVIGKSQNDRRKPRESFGTLEPSQNCSHVKGPKDDTRDTNNDSCCKSASADQTSHKTPSVGSLDFAKVSQSNAPLGDQSVSDDFVASFHANLVGSVSRIGKVSRRKASFADQSVSNQTLFFSPVEASESQVYLTPFSQNASLEPRYQVGIFSDASNAGIQSTVEDENMRLNSNAFEFSEQTKSNQQYSDTTIEPAYDGFSAPSACHTDTSNSRLLWQSSLKSEAVADLNHIMSKLKVDSSSRTFEVTSTHAT
jgi:hypothetical protein